MLPERKEILKRVAEEYWYFLNSIRWDNELYKSGMKEARTKFLANLHITILTKHLPRGYRRRWYTADYVSPRAIKLLQKGKWGSGELIYEHMVPKTEYIIKECEKKIQEEKEIDKDFIYDMLDKYLWIATIHEDENKGLLKNSMPNGWNKEDIFARYKEKDKEIELIPHDRSYFNKKKIKL
ncbi:hypothetical protein V7056_06065 [Bacillus sp. JJ664]